MNLKARITIILLAILSFSFYLAQPGYAAVPLGDSSHIIELSRSGYERGHALAFSSDGKYLAVGGISGIYLFDFKHLSKIGFIETGTWARSISFLPNTHILVAGLFDNSIKTWKIPENKQLLHLEDPEGWVRSISVSGDGLIMASVSDDNVLRVWDLQSGSPILVLEDINGVRSVALSRDGKLVAGGTKDNIVRVWNVLDGQLAFTLKGHKDWVRCLDFSPDGQILASAGFDKDIILWDMTDGSLIRTMKGHNSTVLSIDFSPDGNLLASASVDQTVRLWKISDGEPVQVFRGHQDFVYAVAFSPDGKVLTSGAGDNSVRLWGVDVFNKIVTGSSSSQNETPSDCRVCHHRRSTFEPARVIEMSCETCHTGGASLAWCTNFPQAEFAGSNPISNADIREISGFPTNDDNVAIVIASPSNWETFYVKGDYLVQEIISGKVLYEDEELMTDIEVRLDVWSGNQITTSQIIHPTPSGEFSFDVDINPGLIQAQAPNLFCRGCHEKVGSGISLPHGEVHIVISAMTPDGSQAFDDRWLRVDSSVEASVAIQINDSLSGEPIPGLLVQTSTLLYEWRNRVASATTDATGVAHLTIESLTQADTTHYLHIPPQVIDGWSYSSDEVIQLNLKPEQTSYPTITINAHAQTGSLVGELIGENLPTGLDGIIISAVRLPGGPVYQVPLEEDYSYEFEVLPIGQYYIFADPITLAQFGLNARREAFDLTQSLRAIARLVAEKGSSIVGSVKAQDGSPIPFAWISVNESPQVNPSNLVTGEYLIPNLPKDANCLTVSAPGYYSLPLSFNQSRATLDFRLVPLPEMQHFPWGSGVVYLPPETIVTFDNQNITLKQGWVWGESVTPDPLSIHVSRVDVNIIRGKFALENPVDSGVAWLYIYEGEGQVIFQDNGISTKLGNNQMIALMDGAEPLILNPSVVAGLHTTLPQLPIHAIIEPSLKARFESMMMSVGIRSVQIITLVTYISILAALIGFPLLLIMWARKRELKISGVKRDY